MTLCRADRELLAIWAEHGIPDDLGTRQFALEVILPRLTEAYGESEALVADLLDLEPSDGPVLAAHRWPTNAELIADCHRLGYLREDDSILDPTFGEGVWWKAWRPEKLTTHHRRTDGSDFRDLPYPDGSFDAVAYDPPYVCPGGRKTSTVQAMHDRYGMAEGGHDDPDFRNPAELQQLIDDGLTEMARLVRPARTKNDGGIILAKCQNYIWGGHLWEGAELTREHARALGLVVVDRLEMVGTPGPQPTVNLDGSPRRQVHARRNLSTLWVFRKPKSAPTAQPGLFDEPTASEIGAQVCVDTLDIGAVVDRLDGATS